MSDNVNIPLLRKAVEWVEHQATLPEIDREWDQGFYVLHPLGRARIMLAEQEGRAQRLTHRDLEQVDHIYEVAAHCGTAFCVAGYVGQLADDRYVRSDSVGGVHVSDFAKELLGISYSDSERLFDGNNTAADVRRIAEEIAGQRL